MSLASSPEYLFRPEDQAMKMLFPNIAEDANSFDEFFNAEMYTLDANSEDSSEQPTEVENLFRNDASMEDEFRLPSLGRITKPRPVAYPTLARGGVVLEANPTAFAFGCREDSKSGNQETRSNPNNEFL